ncbi:MAG: glycoside hydrolase family 130 protein [Verrucomicrobiales bacterium]|jgi:beta-1,4-mannooligosaccharide/beta-1,4-mannosyl-N-acetylglucosamine phosphorylase|nr:glycoside hydrolase family 130 protein [Verrucomicrobiales bacterium]
MSTPFPWQEPPADCELPIWRYTRNPIINRNPFPGVAKIYNSAVTPFDGAYAGVFRAEYRTGMSHLHVGRSADGIHWDFAPAPIPVTAGADEPAFDYGYDPRLCRVGEEYFITWCNGYHGPTIGLASTRDFKNFTQLENAFLPCNRNGVLFPRKINGHYAILSRPSDQGHTPFGDIFYSVSPDLTHWGQHRFVMGAGPEWWQAKKIGAGPNPIETPAGWLLIYHGVCGTCNGFIYSAGLALLDLERPWHVIKRCPGYIMAPEEPYEVTGSVPNVAFPSSALVDAATGRVAFYYGAADTVTGLAFSTVDRLLDYVNTHGK